MRHTARHALLKDRQHRALTQIAEAGREARIPREPLGPDPHWDRIRYEILPGDARDFTGEGQ